MSKNKSKAKQLKSLKIKKRVLIAIEAIVATLVIAAAVIVFVPSVRSYVITAVAKTPWGRDIIKSIGQEKFDKGVYDFEFDETQIQTNDMEYNYSSEYTNFVLFGIDSRTAQFDGGTNSDSIVIVSIHNTTGEVRMVSVYRDTFLRIYKEDGTTYDNKINAAYSSGGAIGAINTLNKNLDLQITDYVTVNFSGVSKIIDTLGGIEVNLTDDELAQLNKHLKSTMSSMGVYDAGVKQSGKNIHLNGVQATTYCRIRKATFYDPDTGDVIKDDFGRAARQRLVIMKLVEKAKKANIEELSDMIDVVIGENTEEKKIIQTSFTMDEMIDLLPVIFKFSLEGSRGFPRKLTTGYIGQISYVFAKGLPRNVRLLHKFLYGEEDYQPTQTVQDIDYELRMQSGVTEDASDDSVDDTIHSADGGVVREEETTSTNVTSFDYDDGGNSEYY